MKLPFSPNPNFFGLDIGTKSIRLVQLLPGPLPRALYKYAYVPMDSKLARSDAIEDQKKVANLVAQLVKQAGITTKNVAVGIPSNRVFTSVADVEKLPITELAKAIPYQADSLIPTPLAESKIDWALIGDSPSDKSKSEILITSVTNSFVENQLDLLEAVGLNVIAFEPDNISLARALHDPAITAAQFIIDIGHASTDLVAVFNGSPHLTRNIPSGVEAIIKSATGNMKVDAAQAEQYVFKFGLSKTQFEGQVLKAVQGTIDSIMSEIEKSIKFFQTRYGDVKVEKIIVTGGASVIPEFPLYIANKFGINVEIGNAWKNVSFSPDRQNELLNISNQFSVAVGLAERNI